MTKKKEEVVFYERFLIVKAKTAPTITIAAIIAMVEIAKYISVGGCAAIGWGVGVAGDGSTAKAVIAFEGQYDSDPAKFA